jgi:hypothetical protein
MSNDNENTVLLEEASAALERELIAHYLEPYREIWSLLEPEEQRRLKVEASTWASSILANPNAALGENGGRRER